MPVGSRSVRLTEDDGLISDGVLCDEEIVEEADMEGFRHHGLHCVGLKINNF